MISLIQIWGKANQIEDEYIYHPLICHLLDTASVAMELWDKILSPQIKSIIASIWHIKDAEAKVFIGFLAACHDIGKATPLFQSKLDEKSDEFKIDIWKNLQGSYYHPELSIRITQNYLKNSKNIISIDAEDMIFDMAYILGAHHGYFMSISKYNELDDEYLGEDAWKQIQNDILDNVKSHISEELPQDSKTIKLKKNNHKSENDYSSYYYAGLMFLSGLISVADWIASNENFFPFAKIEDSAGSHYIDKYYTISKKNAKKALDKIGWLSRTQDMGECKNFSELFPFIEEIRPLQQKILDVLNDIENGSLVIIEAPMGEGKTEAAFYLQHYLGQKKDTKGTYIALPTQATANQMFIRLRDFLENSETQAKVNLHLVHGNAVMSEDYQVLKEKSDKIKHKINDIDDEITTVVADDWFTYRKRALISPFGVGTVDQIMLAVLPIKHFFVRLFGLAGKTVIIDEIHAYDIYMTTIINRLIMWLRFLGSNVILLSATLPSDKRNELIISYYGDRNFIKNIQKKNSGIADIEQQAYPRITICNPKELIADTFEVHLKKEDKDAVNMQWIDEGLIIEKVKDKLQKGGRAAIICNTVARAQLLYCNIYRELHEKGFEVDLLHARYPYYIRYKKENDLLRDYGKSEDHTDFKRVLVSTQIIEQSLDLDFDVMISDLSPIDLLLQRLGRLHRHPKIIKTGTKNTYVDVKRSRLLQKPFFYVIQPTLDKSKIPKIGFSVYSNYLLLKTYLLLDRLTQINIPSSITDLIEEVYVKEDEYLVKNCSIDNKEQLRAKLSELKSNQMKNRSEDHLQADYAIIDSPLKSDMLLNLWRNSRVGNENSINARLSTRLAQPMISILPIFSFSGESNRDKENDHIYYLTPSGCMRISLSEKPDKKQVKQILNYCVKINGYSIIKYFYENISIPKKWKTNALISRIYPAKFQITQIEGFFKLDQEESSCYVDLYYHEQLGVLKIRKNKEDGIDEYKI
ncbi:MAG: CRISPR-associated helicase Cas3' [Candidatus Lokiarchaeota archaeon]|nr:CRISPR-associated helicase Cas3' [Candidatus Lokiarchaeota archaeon]